MAAVLVWLYNDGDERGPEEMHITPYTFRSLRALSNSRRALVVRRVSRTFAPHTPAWWQLTSEGYEIAAEYAEQLRQARAQLKDSP